jgi:hypothetical protein
MAGTATGSAVTNAPQTDSENLTMRLSTTFAAGSLAVLASLLAAPAFAAPILGTAGAGHQNAGLPMENNRRYWDGNSWDSNGRMDGTSQNPCSAGSLANGIPCHLTSDAAATAAASGLPGGTVNLANSGPGYMAWGNNDGSADMNFGFQTGNAGMAYDFTMLGELTLDWNVNEIGWYELGNPQNRHTIFGSGAAVGSTARVFIPTNFGFYYLNTSGNGEMFFTQSMYNTVGNNQQFAAFQRGEYTILGVEDIFSNTITPYGQNGNSDYDFNDVMFGFQRASVPEPGTLLLLGLGFAGAVAARRRKATA